MASSAVITLTTLELEKTSIRFRPLRSPTEEYQCSLILSPRPIIQHSTTTNTTTSSFCKATSRCCEKKKKKEYGLVDYGSLPEFLMDNQFILRYYRSEWPLKQALLSLFSIHNETVNVWTHLVGFIAFLTLTLSLSFSTTTAAIIRSNEQQQQQVVVCCWPFYAYMAGAMFCLLMSSACHLLHCHSEHTCYLMLRLDYAGISALIVTSIYPIVYYSFVSHPTTRAIYLSFITLFGLAAVLVSILPRFQTPRFLPLRTALFVCMALSGLVPIAHKVIAFRDAPEALLTATYEMAMFALYGLGVLLYAAKLPERWMPGRFDIIGHSHQLFHILVIAGAYTHYHASLVYLAWRGTTHHGLSGF